MNTSLEDAIAKAEAKADYKETPLHRSLRLATETTEKRTNKYNVSPEDKRTYDGILFDSRDEMEEWPELLLQQKAGLIIELQRQVRFCLFDGFIDNTGKKQRPIYYIADYYYKDKAAHEYVKDIKGHKTATYELKKKLFLFRYPHITFLEERR